VLEGARQDREDAAQRAQAVADLAATGIRVIDAPAWSGPTKRLGWAVRDAEGRDLMAEQHTACPGHVAWVEQDWVNVAADGQVYDDDLDAMDEVQCPGPRPCGGGSRWLAARTPPRTIPARASWQPAAPGWLTRGSPGPRLARGLRPRLRIGGG